MSILKLPYDILCLIFTILDRQSLVSFACASQYFRQSILPKLYTHIDLVGTAREYAKLRLFCRCVIESDSHIADAVSSLQVGSVPQAIETLFAEMLRKTRNIYDIHIRSIHHFSCALIPDSLSSLGNLRHLRLGGVSQRSLTHFMGSRFSGLLTLDLRGVTESACVISTKYSLGKALLHSQSTLNEISLQTLILHDCFSLPTHTDAQIERIWPRVHTLDLIDSTVHGLDTGVDLSHSFPSVRRFSSPSGKVWVSRSCNIPFIARLESIVTTWEEMRLALPSFSELRRAVIWRGTLPDDFALAEYLPSTLQSLELTFFGDFLPCYFDELAEVTPNLEFLCINLECMVVEDLISCAVSSFYCHQKNAWILTWFHFLCGKTKLMTCARRLPLRYLIFRCHWILRGNSAAHTVAKDGIQRYWDTAITASMLDSLPTLQAVCLKIFDFEKHWERDVLVESPSLRRFMDVSGEMWIWSSGENLRIL